VKLLYDHQIFTLQRYGGISRYFCELMDYYSRMSKLTFILALRQSENENLITRSTLNQYWSNKSLFFSSAIFKVIQKYMRINLLKKYNINKNESIRLLKKNNFDIFHPTYYNPYFLQYLGKKPFVLTVYDMIHELYPSYFSPNDPTKTWKRKLIEQADTIIAISHNTKKDIMKYTNVHPDQIKVVYLGNPFDYMNNHNHSNFEYHLFEKPFLLYVGNRYGYKNFQFFIKSVAEILKNEEDMRVYCAGGGQFTQAELKIFNNLGINSKVSLIEINDIILKKLYENAQAFIFPSLYEGFGLPILEAFSCGCPAILSDCSSLTEVGGDAAYYFNPTDPDSMRSAIHNVINDEKLRCQMISKGKKRVQEFSWKNTAIATKRVYENLI